MQRKLLGYRVQEAGGKIKKKIKPGLWGPKHQGSKPVECVRVWPLTSLNVLQDCCDSLTATKMSISVQQCGCSSPCKYPVQGLTLIYSLPQSVLVHGVHIFIQPRRRSTSSLALTLSAFLLVLSLHGEKKTNMHTVTKRFYFSSFFYGFCKLLSSQASRYLVFGINFFVCLHLFYFFFYWMFLLDYFYIFFCLYIFI